MMLRGRPEFGRHDLSTSLAQEVHAAFLESDDVRLHISILFYIVMRIIPLYVAILEVVGGLRGLTLLGQPRNLAG